MEAIEVGGQVGGTRNPTGPYPAALSAIGCDAKPENDRVSWASLNKWAEADASTHLFGPVTGPEVRPYFSTRTNSPLVASTAIRNLASSWQIGRAHV